MEAVNEMFRDNAPMSAAEAAAVILQGVRDERWRILVGDDAVALDERVRADPEHAYDTMLLGDEFGDAMEQVAPESERRRRRLSATPLSSVSARGARRFQPRGVSTRSLVLPSGNANGARTPVCATAAGSTSGPRPADTSARSSPSDAIGAPAPP